MIRWTVLSCFVWISAASACSGDEGSARSSSAATGGTAGSATVTTSSSSGGSTGWVGGAGGAGPTSSASSSTSASSSSSGGAGGMPIDAAGGASNSGAGGTSSDAAAGGNGGGFTAMDAGSDASSVACTPGTGTADVGAKSVLDRKTCLVWEKLPSASMTNKQAAKYCDALTQDGFSDWRVPAPEELATSPSFVANSNAYVTNPIYIPTNSTSDQEGCTGNSHSCNLTQYNAGSIACAWQGVGFSGPVVCVRGTAAGGTTAAAYRAASCMGCSSHVTGATADFKLADCLPFAQ